MFSALGFALVAAFSQRALSQERGAIALGEAVQGLGVNTRVLMIGAHPDDEDTFLIAWLSRGRHVETAYLSLTRGDGGQNLIGNELGEALGVIRTEELLAARRVDGANQFFTRAYDFGFSKDTIDTYKHWQRDSILADIVRIVRAFRPHVIVAVFSGTRRDGHGHHQVSGLLAREAYDLAGDTVRFPRLVYNEPWTPLKFYRAARFNPEAATLRFDAGEYSPLLGRSYAEIAGESRSQHKSQGFGALQRKGPVLDYLRREASRVNEATPAASEKSLFDGIDTTWARFQSTVSDARARAVLDSLPAVFAAARAAFDPFAPEKLIAPLSRAALWVRSACPPIAANPCERIERSERSTRRTVLHADLAASLDNARIRIQNALRMASGISIEATSLEVLPLDTVVPILVSVYNRGRDTVAISGGMVSGDRGTSISMTRLLPPAGVLRDTLIGRVDSLLQPWWLTGGRTSGMFVLPGSGIAENKRALYPAVMYSVDLGGRSMAEMITFPEPVIFRYADDVRGEVHHPVSSAPFVTVVLDLQNQYAQANAPFDRDIAVRLRSADPNPRDVRVMLALPRGLTADSAIRTTRLGGYDARQTVTFRVRGRLPAGEHRIAAQAESNGMMFNTGYQLIDYDHIRRQRIYRPATTTVSAVDVRVPPTLRLAYVTGVGDNVAPTLMQLGIPVTIIPASEVARADLHAYTTVVVGPRAYEAHPDLVAASTRLFDFARKGGTLVVQYGQFEMAQPGVMPYPITLARPADRVTEEDSPVTIEAPNEKELRLPNRIGASDFAGWVQERALYMPRTFDPRYRTLLSMHDTGEPPNRGAVLVAPFGDGVYIYTTISFFRQLPAGVPGGARLFVNLLSAGIASPRINP